MQVTLKKKLPLHQPVLPTKTAFLNRCRQFKAKIFL